MKMEIVNNEFQTPVTDLKSMTTFPVLQTGNYTYYFDDHENISYSTSLTASPPTIYAQQQLLSSLNVTNMDEKTLKHIYQTLLMYTLAQNITQSNPNPALSFSLYNIWMNLTAELRLHNVSLHDDNSHHAYENSLYDVPPAVVIVLSIFYGSISLVAVLGNALVMWVVATSRMLHSVTNYFIANLALADIIIGLFSIPFQFQAALLQRWNLPHFMCAFCPFFQTVSVNVSIFTLTAIAVDRYRAICFPLNARPSKFRSRIVLLLIWTFSSVLAVPMAVALRVKLVKDDRSGTVTPICKAHNMEENLFSTYRHLLAGIQYFVPLGIISYTYIKIAHKLWGSQTPGNAEDARDAHVLKNKKKAIKMLFVVVALFAVCWLPLQAYYVLQTIFPNINEYRYINILWFCFHWLAMSNSCVNPFIYAIYNEKFKREFRHKFRCCFREQVLLPQEQSELERSRMTRMSYRSTRSSFANTMHNRQHHNQHSTSHNWNYPVLAPLGDGMHSNLTLRLSPRLGDQQYINNKNKEGRRRQRLFTSSTNATKGMSKNVHKFSPDYSSKCGEGNCFLSPLQTNGCMEVLSEDIISVQTSFNNEEISEASFNNADPSPPTDRINDPLFMEDNKSLDDIDS